MQARSLTLLFAAVIAVGFVISQKARAHGDAHWIGSNPRYVTESGGHCCGITDCHRAQAALFREAPEGIYVTTGAGVEVLMPRRLVGQGLYPSIDGDWWMCVQGGVIKCVFKPATGG